MIFVNCDVICVNCVVDFGRGIVICVKCNAIFIKYFNILRQYVMIAMGKNSISVKHAAIRKGCIDTTVEQNLIVVNK